MTITVSKKAFRDLNVDEIDVEFDLRSSIDEDALVGLAKSVKQSDGPLQPILVTIDKTTKRHRLVLGGRRLKATKLADLKTIPSVIADNISEKKTLIMALAENLQREDLEAFEIARGIKELSSRFRMKQSEIAQSLGYGDRFVREHLALLKLPRTIQEMLAQGKLGVEHATTLTKLAGKDDKQISIAEATIDRSLSGEMVERMVSEQLRKKRSRKKTTRKHNIKVTGPELAPSMQQAKLQQIVLQGERLLNNLGDIPINRWNQSQVSRLGDAVKAIKDGLSQFSSKVDRRKKKKT